MQVFYPEIEALCTVWDTTYTTGGLWCLKLGRTAHSNGRNGMKRTVTDSNSWFPCVWYHSNHSNPAIIMSRPPLSSVLWRIHNIMQSVETEGETHVDNEGHDEHDQHKLHLRVRDVVQQHRLQLEHQRAEKHSVTKHTLSHTLVLKKAKRLFKRGAVNIATMTLKHKGDPQPQTNNQPNKTLVPEAGWYSFGWRSMFPFCSKDNSFSLFSPKPFILPLFFRLDFLLTLNCHQRFQTQHREERTWLTLPLSPSSG